MQYTDHDMLVLVFVEVYYKRLIVVDGNGRNMKFTSNINTEVISSEFLFSVGVVDLNGMFETNVHMYEL